MADDDSDSPLVDWAKGVYKGANDLVNKIPTPGYKPDSSTDSGKLPQQWEDANKRSADAQMHPTETKAQARPALKAKMVVKAMKPSPRKQGY